MTFLKSFFAAAILAGALMITGGLSDKAQAQQAFEGDFMIRLLGASIKPDTDLGRTTAFAGGFLIAGADADIEDTIVPATTLTYFVNSNIALELFCCVSRVDVDGKGALAFAGELATTSFFAPTVTLQYHFTPMGAFKPYVGAGVNYLMFFNEDVGSGLAGVGYTNVDVDNSFGFALQAGVDVALGGNWSLNLDIKKIFNETDVTWTGGALGTIQANDLQVDPLIISVGVGYRFDLCTLFDRCAPEPLK